MKPNTKTLLAGVAAAAGSLPGATAPNAASANPNQPRSAVVEQAAERLRDDPNLSSAIRQTIEGPKYPAQPMRPMKHDYNTTPAGVPGEGRGVPDVPGSGVVVENPPFNMQESPFSSTPFSGAKVEVVQLQPGAETPGPDGFLPSEEGETAVIETGVDNGGSLPPVPSTSAGETISGTPSPAQLRKAGILPHRPPHNSTHTTTGGGMESQGTTQTSVPGSGPNNVTPPTEGHTPPPPVTQP